MAFVVDASMAAAWFLPDERNDAADRLMANLAVDPGHVPSLFWFETRNLFLIAERRGRLARRSRFVDGAVRLFPLSRRGFGERSTGFGSRRAHGSPAMTPAISLWPRPKNCRWRRSTRNSSPPRAPKMFPCSDLWARHEAVNRKHPPPSTCSPACCRWPRATNSPTRSMRRRSTRWRIWPKPAPARIPCGRSPATSPISKPGRAPRPERRSPGRHPRRACCASSPIIYGTKRSGRKIPITACRSPSPTPCARRGDCALRPARASHGAPPARVVGDAASLARRRRPVRQSRHPQRFASFDPRR